MSHNGWGYRCSTKSDAWKAAYLKRCQQVDLYSKKKHTHKNWLFKKRKKVLSVCWKPDLVSTPVMNDVKLHKCTVQFKCQQVQSNPNKHSQDDRQYIRICTLLTAMKFDNMSYACHAKNDEDDDDADKCLNVCLDTGR